MDIDDQVLKLYLVRRGCTPKDRRAWGGQLRLWQYEFRDDARDVCVCEMYENQVSTLPLQ